MSDEPPAVPETSSDELLGKLAEELSLLIRSDLELAVAERGPLLRRLAVELAAAVAVAVTSVLALGALSLAGAQGLAHVMPSWCASLVVACAWALAAGLLMLLDHPRRLLRRLSSETSKAGLGIAMRDRNDAERSLKATSERLGEAVAREATERELRAPIDRAERLLGSADSEAGDVLKELVAALLVPGKAGLGLLDVMIGRRRRRES
jgi:hypothetical protein